MPRPTDSIAGLAATTVVAAGPGLAEAGPSTPRQEGWVRISGLCRHRPR